jgi:hypothetical protein
MPKVGPFKAVSFKIPTKQTEDMYIKSVDATVEDYSGLLRATKTGTLDLPNRDFDTGRETRPGEYSLTDTTYAQLVDKLATKISDPINPALRENLLRFYSDPNAHDAIRKNVKDWQKLQQELAQLKLQPGAQDPEQPHVQPQ